MRTIFYAALLVTCTLTTACNKFDEIRGIDKDSKQTDPATFSDETNTKTETFSYEFQYNGCKTGRQSFKSKGDLCNALQNNTLNNNCASGLRANYFQKNCPNQTFNAFNENASASENSHILQVTVLNFLSGGLESCDVKNKIFPFSLNDKNLEVPICKNSRVKVYATSDSGTVTFHATDIINQFELPSSNNSERQNFELGKTKGMLRYAVENPYGFTYVMAEEVTGIDKQLLEQWNQLSGRAAELRGQIIKAQQQGKPAPASTVKELEKIEMELFLLSEKMQGSN